MTRMQALWPFQRSRASADAEKLLATVTQISRQPCFFGEGRLADTLEGRLELLTLHASLALVRLRHESGAEPLAQSFVDMLFRHIDSGLREAGVGDMAVPKRMHALAGSFYGRLEAYAGAITSDDSAALADALARNALKQEGAPYAATLATYSFATAKKQAEAPLDTLARLDGWAQAPA